MHVVIMAGGKGTRISAIANDIPKPMIDICGKPVLEHQINCLSSQGYKKYTIIVGHLGKIIKEYFGDGSNFGIEIDYIEEMDPLGTAGALFYMKSVISDTFILLNGDILFDINVERFLNYHRSNKGTITLFTHPNNHPFDSGLIITNSEGLVENWLHKEDERTTYKNRVNAGLHIIDAEVLDIFKEPKKTDLDRDVLKPLVRQGKVYAYDSPEYVKDMGTPERYHEICEDLLSGIVTGKNLGVKQKAIFLDRDGTINKHIGFINNPDDIELINGVAEAIAKINRSKYLAIVITNQPVIARGECSFVEMDNIHNKLETLLGEKGAYLDDIIYCPHHPDKGFEGERVELKIECDCRKPKTGMFYEAKEKYNIDLAQSFMIGDDMRDIEAGMVAGCRVALVGSCMKDHNNTVDKYKDLLHCINEIIIK